MTRQPEQTISPRPWAVNRPGVITDNHLNKIADVFPWHHHGEANARLIAAAPDMLQALAYVVNWHQEHDSGEGELFGLDCVTACISALRQADPDWHTTSNDEVTP